MKKFPVIELFTSIQGEGIYMGHPSVFVRTTGCNLRCSFKGSICDTPYSSYNPEKPKYSLDDVIEQFQNHRVKHLVITGGEPMIHQESIVEMIDACAKVVKSKYGELLKVTIETNATIKPIKELLDNNLIFWSMSPKLSTSEPVAGQNGITPVQARLHKENRINISAIVSMLTSYNSGVMKFVYSDESSYIEIKSLMSVIEKELSLYRETGLYCPKDINNNIMLMPEGITNEQLQSTRIACAEHCISEGWLYTDRLHIVIWGNKRGV